jgi:Protein of unknown function (DUF3024)
MPLPDEDVELVRRFVDGLNADMPPHVASQLRYRLDVYRNALTIVECRAVDPDEPASDWFDVFVARLRFTRSRGWELYWPDRDSNFHLYEDVEPTQHVSVLLAEIESDPTAIFFG